MKKLSCLNLLLCLLLLVQKLYIPAFATETEQPETVPEQTIQPTAPE